MNRSEKKTGLPVISEPQSLALKNIKSAHAAVQILETIRFILFCDDSFTRGQSNMRRFIYKRSLVTGVFFLTHAYVLSMYIGITFSWSLILSIMIVAHSFNYHND